MSTQERVASKAKDANKKFEAIFEAAVAKVMGDSSLRPEAAEEEAWGEANQAEGHEATLANSVRHLRDHQGVAWWKIGEMLGLPGAGTSAATGKAGAAQARRLYAKGFGAAPRTQKERKPETEKRTRQPANEVRAAVKAQPAEERRAMVRAGKPVIGDDWTDQQIVEAIKGRTISWTINLNDIDGKGDEFYEHSADVHRIMVRVEVNQNGERVIRFKEVNRSAPIDVRELAGATRTVRVRSIHAVR